MSSSITTRSLRHLFKSLSAAEPSLFQQHSLLRCPDGDVCAVPSQLRHASIISTPLTEVTDRFPQLKSYDDLYKLSIEKVRRFMHRFMNVIY